MMAWSYDILLPLVYLHYYVIKRAPEGYIGPMGKPIMIKLQSADNLQQKVNRVYHLKVIKSKFLQKEESEEDSLFLIQMDLRSSNQIPKMSFKISPNYLVFFRFVRIIPHKFLFLLIILLFASFFAVSF